MTQAVFGHRLATKNIVLKQGATWAGSITFTNSADGTAKDMTGAILRGQIRKNRLDTGTPLIAITFAWIDITLGTAEYVVTAAETTAITVGERKTDSSSLHFYDIELVYAGVTYRLVQGQIQVDAEVTK